MNTIATFKIIFRSWWRNKLFILISLISLTVGLGCTNLLVTFFIHEYNIEQQTCSVSASFGFVLRSPMAAKQIHWAKPKPLSIQQGGTKI